MKLKLRTDDGTVDREVTVDRTARGNLADTLAAAGIMLNRRCGGTGSCGGCNVVIENGGFDVRGTIPTAGPERHRNVLACHILPVGDNQAERIPSRSLLEVGGEIEAEFEIKRHGSVPSVRNLTVAVPPASLRDHRSDVERLIAVLSKGIGSPVLMPYAVAASMPGVTHPAAVTATLAHAADGWRIVELRPANVLPLIGVAIDVGTTTVAGLLVNIETGEILVRSTRYNQQIQIADDVASRISGARTADQRKQLQNLVVRGTITPIIDSLCHMEELTRSDIGRVAIAGNTVMTHLLLGLPVEGIGRAPFTPVVRAPAGVRARDLALPLRPDTYVDVLPAISGYIGGDVSADIHAAELMARAPGTVLLDLGTNCEIVLRDSVGLVACSTPAGPAFEGGGLSQGMRATDGAIATVRIDDDLDFELASIGTGRPRGVCGSAVIDFVAQAHLAGLISRSGRFDTEKLRELDRLSHVTMGGRKIAACRLTPAKGSGTGEPVLITERDIAEVLQAKSAVYAGIKTPLGHRGWQLKDIPEFLLAGGFASKINIENGITLGLLPRLEKTRFTILGNGALAGAYLSLTDHTALPAMLALHTQPEVGELNLIPEFEGNFIDGLFLPRPHSAIGDLPVAVRPSS